MKTIVATHNPDLARDFDRDLLRRGDIRLVTVRTRMELIERLRSGADLCLLDRVLPDADGTATLADIRRDHPNLPVMLIVGAGAPALAADEAKQLGFTDVLEMPAPFGSLSLLVAEYLKLPTRSERVGVREPVFDLAPSSVAQTFIGRAVDISEAGVLVEAQRTYPPGQVLALRLTLPGGHGDIRPRGRVVRCDARAFAPAIGLALAFDTLADAERKAIGAYHADLTAGRPFHWELGAENGRETVALFGILRSDTVLDGLRGLRGDIEFRMHELARFDAEGASRWIELSSGLEHARSISLVECPTSFVAQANLIPNLLDKQEVVSFYAPYACRNCSLEEDRLIQTSALSAPIAPPELTCSACRAPLSFDGIVEQYFAFLKKS